MITVLSSEAKLNYPVIRGNYNGCKYNIEVCMGMGLIGIPWVPWDFHGNGNHCDSIMGMGMGITAWEWELNNGNGNGFPCICSPQNPIIIMHACECNIVSI